MTLFGYKKGEKVIYANTYYTVIESDLQNTTLQSEKEKRYVTCKTNSWHLRPAEDKQK